MADLMWSKNDGFEPGGRRAASVVWCVDPGPVGVQGGGHSGPAFFAPGWGWEAFVSRDGRFDHVTVDGKPGRWSKKDEAKAAAESAYRAWITQSTSDPTKVASHGTETATGDDVDKHHQNPSGPLSHLRSLVRAWRTVYRSGQDTPPA